MIKAIAFDADDTLWDCQSHFEAVERRYCELLTPYCDVEKISCELFKTESKNMDELGYGCKAFTISLVENAIRVSNGRISASCLSEILELGRSLLRIPATPLPEVETTLTHLSAGSRFQLVVFTKGELLDQENKLRRSGLMPLFNEVFIVSNKTEDEYQKLCRSLQIVPEELLMVGNSFKSDIAPALQVGASAVHIPFHVVWQHECIDEFEHPKLTRITRFSEILQAI